MPRRQCWWAQGRLGRRSRRKARHTRRAPRPYRLTPRTSTATGAWTWRPTTATGSPFSVFLRQPGGGFAEEAGSPFPSASSNGAVGDLQRRRLPGLRRLAASSGERRRGPDPQPRRRLLARAAAVAGQRARARSASATSTATGSADIAVANFGLGGNVSVVPAQRGRHTASTRPRTTRRATTRARSPSPTSTATACSTWRSPTRPPTTSGSCCGNGGGTFTDEGPTPVGTNPNGIAAGDFNGDGRTDLAVSNTGDGTVTVLLRNAANSGFDRRHRLAARGRRLAAADRHDRLRPQRRPGPRRRLLERASTSCSTPARASPATRRRPSRARPTASRSADFNADGVPDAAVSLARPRTR